VTKVKAHAPGEIARAIDSSLRRLRVSKLSALLLHSMPDGESLFNIAEEMAERVDDGQVDLIGISVYETQHALDVLRTPRLSITQVPTNLLDHRFIEAGCFDAGISERKRVDVRSVFLQGLLALSPDALPSHLKAAREPLRTLERLAAKEKRAVLEIACAFVRDIPGVAGVLFGAETPEQVRMNARWWRSPGLSEELRAGIFKSFAHVPEAVIDPRLWPAA
jgi:aryl-alcohol dehydrogenase-like predicted oxidoreductase